MSAVWLDGKAGVFLVGSARYPCCIVMDEPPPYHRRMCLAVQIALSLTGQDKMPFALEENK